MTKTWTPFSIVYTCSISVAGPYPLERSKLQQSGLIMNQTNMYNMFL